MKKVNYEKNTNFKTFNNRCMFIGGIISGLAVYNRCGQMKKLFTKLGLPAWQVGPISVIGAGFLRDEFERSFYAVM